MNDHLTSLRGELSKRHGTTERDLLDALFMIRAHYSLAGIILCCRRVTELVDRFPQIRNDPAFADQDQRLATLGGIAALDESVDEHLLDGTIRRYSSDTPLRPYTGESGLCDVLLVEPELVAGQAHRDAFAWLQAWFVWQTFHHQARCHDPDAHAQYLAGADDTLLNQGKGNRIYNAFVTLRGLADSGCHASVHALAELLRQIDGRVAKQLAIEMKVAMATTPMREYRDQLRRDYQLGKTDVEAAVDHIRGLQGMADGGLGSLANIARFLERVWLRPGFDYKTDRRRRIGRSRPFQVKRHGATVAVTQPVAGEAVHDGTVVEIHDQPKAGPEAGKEAVLAPGDVADDPEDEPPVEPAVQLFLARGDAMTAWYAAKSAAHHIERANAILPWPKWRLSSAAIARVLSLVRLQSTESRVVQRARLALGLSLLTGRSLDEVTAPQITEGPVPEDRIGISLPDHVLQVPAGAPKLTSFTPSNDPLPKYCARWSSTLRLSLPKAWWPLIDALAGNTNRRHESVPKEARSLIDTLPSELAVTPKGVADALKLALLEAANDDLAVVKMVTDANDANLNNLIHYASRERAELERLWHDIVSGWVGPLAGPPAAGHEGERVGAPFGIEADKVATGVSALKARIRECIEQQHWAAAYNNLALYLSVWLGLATAGRRTRQPVPGIITPDGWALIRDKHRPDESTDRYVPLGKPLREQIEVLAGISQALGLAHSDFGLPPPGAAHLIELRVFRDDVKTQQFQPKYLDHTTALRDLPGNWGRKLVRSEAGDMPGRLKDAGLGHWVRGRHPWTLTSTFPASVFREQWLAMQARLEQAIGFEVIRIGGIDGRIQPAAYPYPRRKSPRRQSPKLNALDDKAVETLLGACPNQQLYRDTFQADPAVPESAEALACEAIGRADTADAAALAPIAESVCTYIRKHTSVLLFASRPRMRFQHNWLVSEYEFRCLAYFEQQLLPTIERDFARLPAHDERKPAADIGRLIVAAVLRGGLANSGHIDAFLAFLAGDKPVQAVGKARLMEIQVPSRRSQESMRRTVLLEPYLATLVTVDRDAVRPTLQECLDTLPQPFRRRPRWNACLRAYLRRLGLSDELTVAALTAAARQRLQLSASPVLAAYASGEVLTHDLPVAEFRRLAGFAPLQSADPADPEASQSDLNEAEDQRPPADVAKTDFARQLCALKKPDCADWHNRIAQARRDAATPARRLLCGFAAHMVQDHEARKGGQMSQHVRSRITHYVTIVWTGFVGFSDGEKPWDLIDERTLETLFELTEEYFPARRHNGAWGAFQAFLADEEADHAGITVGDVSDAATGAVSARVLSTTELDRAERRLASVQSGIGTALNRRAACRHFGLTRAIGARRAETEQLRWIDVDGDMLRIQPHESHDLKTPASERVIPTAMVDAATWGEIETLRESNAEKIIDAGADHEASGDNFFPDESRVMKEASGSLDLGPHHLRHTTASALALKMLGNTVDLGLLNRELPWVADWLPTDEERDTLLGSAGQTGQGLKAVAVMLGHIHETTTLKHYVHTLGMALHAWHLGLPDRPLHIAFQERIASRATLFRSDKKLREQRDDQAARARKLRDHLETVAEQHHAAAGYDQPLVMVSDKPVPGLSGVMTADADASENAETRIREFEAAHHYLKTGTGQPPARVEALRAAFRTIAAIPSGKRGSGKPRHPMPVRGDHNLPLPEMIRPGRALVNAEVLLAWLDRLRRENPADHAWLIDKWLHGSDEREGAMRLDGDQSLGRVRDMDVDPGLELDVREVRVSASRKRPGQNPRYRLRIRFVQSGAEGQSRTGRASGAVRWALTWVAAWEGLC